MGMANEPPAAARPLPQPTSEDAPFWMACREHRLILPRCRNCSFVWFPPYANCTRCMSTDIEWIGASGRGVVCGWVEMHQPYIPYFASQIPYNVVLIRLEEGPYMYSNVVNARYEDLRVDLPVEVTFEDVNQMISLPKFRLTRQAAD